MDDRTSRRALLRLLPVPLGLPLLAQAQRTAPRPFRVEIPQATIHRILNRVKEARWPDRLDANDWRYGANWDYLKSLAQYWATKFDWRKAEANLNKHPQFIARVEDYDIHFYQVRGRGPKPMPIVLPHGWPGSVFEFLEAIGPLSDPARFGGAAEDAFDVVVPSLPGFGFSSKPKGKPIGPRTTARLWHQLMTGVLGYQRYGAQGGDWGYAVTVALAGQYPDSLAGIHLNAASARPAPEAEQSEEERAWQRASAAHRAAELDYLNEQQHKPQTVAFVLSDSPLGAAAWIVEKFKGWSDSGDDIEKAFTKDQLLTNLMIYLVTDTVGTAVWFYRGSIDEGPAPPRAKIMVPTGFAAFPREMPALEPPRSALARDYNLVHYSKMPRGGHFACLEQPELFVEDLRAFFRRVRT
jgi:microsomal epoxide hydrolase